MTSRILIHYGFKVAINEFERIEIDLTFKKIYSTAAF
jgi:hypothetical protein